MFFAPSPNFISREMKSTSLASHSSHVSSIGSAILLKTKLLRRDRASKSSNLYSVLVTRSSVAANLTSSVSIFSHAKFNFWLMFSICTAIPSSLSNFAMMKFSLALGSIAIAGLLATWGYGNGVGLSAIAVGPAGHIGGGREYAITGA